MVGPNQGLEFATLSDAHPMRFEVTPGRDPRLIVSFTSVGTKRHEWPAKEFIEVSSQQGANHVMCISDISRSWMNADGMLEKTITTIRRYAKAHGITSIMAIGYSMGGYNALILGRHMQLERVVSFSPQYSVHPDVVRRENRWVYFRRRIVTWPHREMDQLPPASTPVYIFHGDGPKERMHWKRYPTGNNIRHYIFQNSGHMFVEKLKEKKALYKIARAGFNDRIGRMNNVVRRAGGMRREEYEAVASAEAYFKAHKKNVKSDPPA